MKKLLLLKNQGFKSMLLLGLLFLFSNNSWGQTTVFSDSFTGTTNTLVTSAVPSITYNSNLGLTSSTSGAAYINSNQLIIENGNNSTSTNNTSGVGYVRGANSSFGSPYSTTLDSNPNTVTWSFNIRTTRSSLSNTFGTSTSYGGMVVLACDNANPTTAGSKGYALWLARGSSTSFHSFKIVYFTDGVNQAAAPTTICSTADVTPLKYYSLKVTFNPSAGSKLWTLSFRDDGDTAFAQPLSTGTSYNATVSSGTNSTGTNLALANFAFVWRYNTANGNNLYIDNFKVTLDNPTINAPSVSSLIGFTASSNANSAEQSFTVSGQFLTNSIVATAPADYEVSTSSGSGFGSSVSLTNTASQLGTIYVRLKSGLSDGSKTGNITITSTGATTSSDYSVNSHTVALTGNVSSLPTLTSNTSTLTQFANTAAGTNSASSSFALSGVNLSSGDVTVTAPTNFTVSTDNSTFTSSVTLTPSSGSLSSTIYVRYSPTGSGSYNGNVVIACSGLADQNVFVSGYLSAFYYKSGSTSLATVANWSGTADGTGTSLPNDFTTAGVTYQILSSSPTTTDALWTVSGSGSKIIVGNSTLAGVTLTIASGFAIAGTIDVAQSNSASDPNKVVVKEYTTLPNFGTLHDESEVHYQNATAASLSVSTGYTYGKLIVDPGSAAVNFTGSPVVIKKALTVSSGAIGQFSGTSGNWTIINAGAVVTINGKIQSSKLAGIFNFGVATPASANGCLQFVDTPADVATNSRLVLGANSTVEYNRNTFNNTQAISALPPGIKYANLNIVDSYSTTAKSFAAPLTGGTSVTVNGTLTVAQFASTLAGNLIMGDGATIVMAGTNGFSTAPTFGTSVNLSYTPIKMPGVLTFTNGASSGALTTANPNITVGMGVSASGIPDGTTVTSISGTSITLSNAVTATLSTTTAIFDKYLSQTSGNEIPTSDSVLSNIYFNNSAGVILNSNIKVNGILGITTGSLTINPGKILTIAGTADFGGNSVILKSDATGTGSIGTISGTLNNATNVTVERYIPAKRAWRALTSPVNTTSSISANWQENGTGNSTNGFDIWANSGGTGILTGGSGSSLLSYNSSDNSWSGVTDTTTSNSLLSGSVNKPFMAFVTGPFGSNNVTSGASATTIRATGALFTGNQTYVNTATQYTFIGNPYASPLDPALLLADTDNAAFGGNIWVWDANATGLNSVGTYNLFNNGTYANVTSNPAITTGTQIQSGQAFFVKSTTGGTFTIKETHKGTTFSNAVFRTAAPELFRVGLYKQENNEWSGRDGAMTVILSDAAANQAPNKMANSTENIAFTKNGASFASNHHLPLVPSDVFNVKVWNTTAGSNYKLKLNTEAFTATHLAATLEDLYTNSRTSLNLDGSPVEYPFTVTADALSTGNRFKIVFQNAVLGNNNPTTNGFSIVPNPVSGDSFQVNLGALATGTYSYSICNAIGQEVTNGSINSVTQNTNYEVKMSNAATGIYIMKIKGSDNSVYTAKIIKK